MMAIEENAFTKLENQLFSVEKVQEILLKGLMTRGIESLESKLENRMIDMGKKLETILQFISSQSLPTASLDEMERSICADQTTNVSQENLFSTYRKVESGLEGASQAADFVIIILS